MHVFLMIIGLLLILFGGGCTIVFIAVDGDVEFRWLWLALGLAPLVGGFFLIRHGLKLNRESGHSHLMGTSHDTWSHYFSAPGRAWYMVFAGLAREEPIGKRPAAAFEFASHICRLCHSHSSFFRWMWRHIPCELDCRWNAEQRLCRLGNHHRIVLAAAAGRTVYLVAGDAAQK
jgi:hypothetical protein